LGKHKGVRKSKFIASLFWVLASFVAHQVQVALKSLDVFNANAKELFDAINDKYICFFQKSEKPLNNYPYLN